TRWADKNPENVLYVDAWRRLLGDGFCFVHVVRPPFATIASMREANFRLTIPADLDGQIDLYRQYNEAGLAIASRFPERTLRVSYDRLVVSSRAELARLMVWLGEVPEDSQLDFSHVPRDHGLQDPKSANTTGVHRESLERWRLLLDVGDIESIGRRTSDLWQRLIEADRSAA
ncbi:MAG: sulfotransferase, partial [Actinobacteria bacterium]|nr:sulfotransferase [Actinomycetota bacterium]